MPETSQALSSDSRRQPAIQIGRYLLHRQIARGGMATIHIARLVGDEGFTRIVAAKRLHSEFAEDSEFVTMFLDEARVASKIHHRNVVPVLDVVTTGEEVVLVQEYVHGAPLHWLLRTAHEAKVHVPLNVAVAVACGVLAGLQAAHETTDELGGPLDVVHRDVSPQNIMIATDGTPRLLDFGIAKATMAAHITREGVFKGKLAYSAPEQIRGHSNQQSDVYSLAVVLWELIVGHRLHHTAQSEAELIHEIMRGTLPAITEALAEEKEWLGPNRWRQLEVLEPIIRRGLAVDISERWKTAADMEQALSSAVTPATPTAVAQWLKQLGKDFLAMRDRVISAEEQSWRRTADSSMVNTTASHRRIQTDPGAATVMERPTAPTTLRNNTRLWFGAGAAAFLALLALIIWLAHSPEIEAPKGVVQPAPAAAVPAAPAIAAPVAPAAAAITAPAITAPPPAPTATAAPAATTTPVEAAPRPVVRTQPAPVRSAPVTPRIVRSAPQHTAAAAATKSESTPAATTASPAAGSAAPALDCNPPYYFEGKKKIFKTNCL
ncbi:MAG TPA: serine/threonine-protein kinase [Kofleriaceae bacterium]|nr:serine/threonine-protein kinase [Kofleriaceae bacterium]